MTPWRDRCCGRSRPTCRPAGGSAGVDASPPCRDGGHVLDNAVWHALAGPHAAFAEGSGTARRYRRDVSVFHALADDEAASWADLAPLTHPDGTAIVFRALPITPPPGWEEVHVGEGLQMVSVTATRHRRPLPTIDPGSGRAVELRPLTDGDVPAMLALIELTEPGPFRPRTIELGGYVGHLPRRGARRDGRSAHASARLPRDQRGVHPSRAHDAVAMRRSSRPTSPTRSPRAARHRSSTWPAATTRHGRRTSRSASRSAPASRSASIDSSAEPTRPAGRRHARAGVRRRHRRRVVKVDKVGRN